MPSRLFSMRATCEMSGRFVASLCTWPPACSSEGWTSDGRTNSCVSKQGDGKWETNGEAYNKQKKGYTNPEAIAENNFRVLFTRARHGMILVVPNDPDLDETYQYFVKMGMDVL